VIPSRTTRAFGETVASLPNDVRRQAQRAYQGVAQACRSLACLRFPDAKEAHTSRQKRRDVCASRGRSIWVLFAR
jgi:hypothetical protein